MATSSLVWITPEQLGEELHVTPTNTKVVDAAGAANELVASLVASNANIDSARQRMAARQTAIDIYQAANAPGGEAVLSDMTIMPSRMGAALMTRAMGLLGPDVALEVG